MTRCSLALWSADGGSEVDRRVRAYFREIDRALAIPFRPTGEDSLARRLDTWLRAGTSRRALVVGESGAGKSVALAQWAVDLSESERADVVFMPIHRGLGTAAERDAMPLLLRQLSALLSAVPDFFPDALVSRAAVVSMLREGREDGARPLVVLLDGACDAIDFGLDARQHGGRTDLHLFAEPGPGIYVVATQDSTGPDCLDAGALAAPEIQPPNVGAPEVVYVPRLDSQTVKAAFSWSPSSVQRLPPSVGEDLPRVVVGSALLLDLYLQALASDVGAAQTLSGASPGVGGYIEAVGARVSDAAGVSASELASVLNLLASMLGPVRPNEIRRLMTDPGCSPGDEKLTSERLSSALRVARWMIAGDDIDGYAYRHESLARYVREAMTERERSGLERRLLQHGRTALDAYCAGDLPEGHVSAYIVRHYRIHLERADASLAELMTLVSPEWYRAWKSLPASCEGYLADMRHIHAHANTDVLGARSVEARAAAVVALIRCALVEASLLTIGPQLAAGSNNGEVPADEDAAQIGDEGSQARALTALASELVSATSRAEVFGWALGAARAGGDIGALLTVARALEGPERHAAARDAVTGIEAAELEDRPVLLLEAALLLPADEACLVVLDAYRRATGRTHARDSRGTARFAECAARLLPEALVEELWRNAEGSEGSDRTYLLACLAPRMPLPLRAGALECALTEVLAAGGRGGEWEKALGQLARDLPEPLRERALAEAARIDPHAGVLRSLLPPAIPASAAEVARRLSKLSERERAMRLSDDAADFVRLLGPEEAVAMVRRISEAYRAAALAAVAAQLPAAMQREPMAEAMTLARAWAKAVPHDESDRLNGLVKYAGHMEAEHAAELLVRVIAYATDGADTYHRRDFLHDTVWLGLAQLAPLIARAGGEVAVYGVAKEIVDVGRWFP